ncbi:MAG TPA: ribose 5-phosphate isomerase B [Candidatus Limnocylindria bacterium]|nr:ribose 5-phosphate isomerase B [Candidatus Limnocylindria bacterium]
MSDIQESEVRRLVRDAVQRALGPETPAAAPAARPPVAGPPVERTVAIGSDHAGFELKEVLRRWLAEELGWSVHDCGTHSTAAVDYPDFAAAVAREVASGRSARGIIVDAAGIGSAIAANKIPGARCAVCHDDVTARSSREHNDANLMALGARVVHRGQALRLARLFLTTPFAGGRHERRVRKIMALEPGPVSGSRP